MTIICFEDDATIFSRKSAPPPPLIKSRLRSASSAPSIVKSSGATSSRLASEIPSARAFCALRSEVATPMMLRPPRTRGPSRSRKASAVEPVPSPNFIPALTYSNALAAAARFREVESVRDEAMTNISGQSPKQGNALFDGHRFGEISRLVDVGALGDRGVVGEQLYRQRIDERRDKGIAIRHRDCRPGLSPRARDSARVRNQNDLAAARHRFLHVRNRLLEGGVV